MAVMKEEEEKEKQDDLKQTSSFPLDYPRDSSTPTMRKMSHLSLNVCMCVYLRFNLPPQSNATIPQSTTTSPILHTPYLHPR